VQVVLKRTAVVAFFQGPSEDRRIPSNLIESLSITIVPYQVIVIPLRSQSDQSLGPL
jgi:hypothetical protein